MGTAIIIGILAVIVVIAVISSVKHMKGEGGCCGVPKWRWWRYCSRREEDS